MNFRCRNHAKIYFDRVVLTQIRAAHHSRVHTRYITYLDRLSEEEVVHFQLIDVWSTTIDIRAFHRLNQSQIPEIFRANYTSSVDSGCA